MAKDYDGFRTEIPTTPADGSLTLDANEVQFLAARLRRLFNHFKYPLPDWAKDDKHLIGIAPTCIGAVLANLNSDRATPSPGKADAEDAARYRWLREEIANGAVAGESGALVCIFNDEGIDVPEELDRAIDAAMGKT